MHTTTLSAPSLLTSPSMLDASWLRQLCLDAGADDVGFVELERPSLAEERPHIERAFPRTRSLISFVVRMNRENVRSPAGDDVIGPFLASKKAFTDEIVRPLQAKSEPVYVIPGSDAEAHVEKRYPHKTVRHVRGSLRPRSIRALLAGMPHSFQRGAAGRLDATYHFTFTGKETTEATVVIRDDTIKVEQGLSGQSNIHVTADSETWLGFVANEKNLLWSLLTRRIRIRGNPQW